MTGLVRALLFGFGLVSVLASAPAAKAADSFFDHSFYEVRAGTDSYTYEPADAYARFKWETQGSAGVYANYALISTSRGGWNSVSIGALTLTGQSCRAIAVLESSTNARDIYFSALNTPRELGPLSNISGKRTFEFQFRAPGPITTIRIGFWGTEGRNSYLFVHHLHVHCW